MEPSYAANHGHGYGGRAAVAAGATPAGAPQGGVMGRLGRLFPPTGMPNAVASCGNFLLLAATITAFAFAIIACKGTLPATTVGAVLLGCGGFAATWLVFREYKSAKHAAERTGEAFSFKNDMPWQRVAWCVFVHLPAIVAGTLGVIGI